MDRIYVNQIHKESAEVIMGNKINELVEGYNEIREEMLKVWDNVNYLTERVNNDTIRFENHIKEHKAVSYYNELDRRLKKLEKIEVKRMLDNQ